MEYYLKFAVGDIAFATPITEVTEIVRPREVRALEKSPKNVTGVFDLRGEKVPLYNLPEFLEIPAGGSFEVIVSRIEEILVGFKVFRVFGIVAAEELLPFPDIVKAKDFLLGVVPDQDTFLQVLSFAKLISGSRRQALKKIISS
jgi:chemotaxis signal transduction protein